MKKTTLAVAVPLAVVGVAIAGAWYTGSRVEEEISRNITEANTAIQQTGLPVNLTLLNIERGVFSSAARYQVSLAGEAGDEANTLIFSDRIEHGPFPLSRLTSGKLMPVMAQSNIALEQTSIIAPLFEAAGGKTPFTGTVALHYGQSRDVVLETVALQFTHDRDNVRLSPGKLSMFVSGSEVRSDGHLAEIDATIVQPQTGLPVHFALRDLRLNGDQKIDADGFAIGPSSASIESVQSNVEGGPEIFAMRKIVAEGVRKRDEKGLLDQTANYRVGMLAMGGKEIGSLKLGASVRNLDGTAIKALSKAYGEIYRKIIFGTMKGEGTAESLTPAHFTEIQSQLLHLLDSSPTLALDELSLQTAHGAAHMSLVVDLRKPDLNAGAPDAIIQSAFAGLKADAKIDKALIGDLASGAAQQQSKADPAALKQQSDAAVEMFSGMALRSHWARLEGDSLVSSLSYANGQITFNGQAMSVEQFAGSVLGLPVGGEDEYEYEEEFEEAK